MIADLINGILGIVLIYLAILQQPIIGSSRGYLTEFVLGLAIALLAFLAMRVREKWYSRVLIPCGIALALFGFLADLTALPLTLESWFVFWIGVFVSIVAFWGVLYPHNLAPTDVSS